MDDGPLREQVRTLARQLGADELAVRDQAEKALMELGVKALPHLPIASERMKAEMRQRIQRIRDRLEVQQAETATQGGLVSLTFKDQPLSVVLKKLEEQSGNKIVDFRDFRGQPKTDPPISVDLQEVPFWKALDEVLQQAGMSTYPYAIDDEGEPLRGVAFVAGSLGGQAKNRHTCYEGPFRMQPLNVVARRDLREPMASGLDLEIEIAWEPRLAPILLTVIGDSVQAVDSADQPIAVRAMGRRAIEVHGAASTFPLRLDLPERGAASIKRL
ncbi:unnamed protein product, partial [marine sediment metagenome]